MQPAHAAGENFYSRKGFLLFYDWIYGRRKQSDATFDDCTVPVIENVSACGWCVDVMNSQ